MKLRYNREFGVISSSRKTHGIEIDVTKLKFKSDQTLLSKLRYYIQKLLTSIKIM